MYKYRRFIALSLVICMSLGFSAFASALSYEANPEIPSEINVADFTLKSAIVSKDISEVPDEVLVVLEDEGALIMDNTLIEVLPVNEGEDKAICVTNLVGTTVVRNFFVAHEEDTFGKMVVNNAIAEAVITPTGQWDYDWDKTYSQGVTVKGTVYENQYVAATTCVQPFQSYFSYSKTTSYTVSSLMVDFESIGHLYTASNHTFVPHPNYPAGSAAANSELYHFHISSTKTNPTQNQRYVATNRNLITNGWVIDMSADPGGDQFINIEVVLKDSSGQVKDTISDFIFLSRFK